MGVVTRLISMVSLSVFGFIKGFQPIAGYSYGAKKYDRLHEAIRTSILWSTIFCVIVGLILALFPDGIVSRFAPSQTFYVHTAVSQGESVSDVVPSVSQAVKSNVEMVRIGAASLRANGVTIMLFGFCTVYSSLFLALGKGRDGFILGACRQGICFIPVILILPMLCGLNGIIYAQPIADILSAVITGFMAVRLHKELNSNRNRMQK